MTRRGATPSGSSRRRAAPPRSGDRGASTRRQMLRLSAARPASGVDVCKTAGVLRRGRSRRRRSAKTCSAYDAATSGSSRRPGPAGAAHQLRRLPVSADTTGSTAWTAPRRPCGPEASLRGRQRGRARHEARHWQRSGSVGGGTRFAACVDEPCAGSDEVVRPRRAARRARGPGARPRARPPPRPWPLSPVNGLARADARPADSR